MTSPLPTAKSKLDSLPFMKAYLSNNQKMSADDDEQKPQPVLHSATSETYETDRSSTDLPTNGGTTIKSEMQDQSSSAPFLPALGSLKRKFHEMSPEDTMGETGKLLPNGKKTKGRVKIEMKFIGNKLRRYTTFSKRKTGIMKKAFELSTLTGTQVLLLVASETGHVYTFATNKLRPIVTEETGKQLIQQCLNANSAQQQQSASMVVGDAGVEPPTSFEAVASLNANQLTFVPTESSARLFNMPTSNGVAQSHSLTDNEIDDDDDVADVKPSPSPQQHPTAMQQQLIQQLLPSLLANPQALNAAMQMMPGVQQPQSTPNQAPHANAPKVNQSEATNANHQSNALLYALPLAMAMQQQMQQQQTRSDIRK